MPEKSPSLGHDIDLVSIKITVNGSALRESYQVVFVEVEENVNKLPYAYVEILDGDTAAQEMKVTSELNPKHGDDLQIEVGYHQDLDTIFKGVITNVSFQSKQGTHGRLTISGTDAAVAMTVAKETKYHANKKDSQIVSDIVRDYTKVSVEVDATKTTHPKMVQYNTSDWDFILSRARACERFVVARKNTLSFKKPGGSTPIELTYGVDITKIDLHVDSQNQRNSITVKGWDPSTHKFKTGKSAEPSYVDKSGSSAVSGKKLSKALKFKEETIRASNVLDKQELTDIAKSEMLISRLSRVRGKLVMQGTPKLFVNSFVKLKKTHENYQGDVYVTGVKHTLELGNYTTEAKIGLDQDSFTPGGGNGGSAGTTQDNMGLIPGVRGLVIGEVTNIVDPDKEFRVQVKIPIFDESDSGVWARIAGVSASKDSGFIWYPEVGDQVIVGFLQNDPRFPIVMGSLYSKTHDVFKDHQPKTGNNQKAIVTRSHMKIVFQEDKKDILITTPGKQFIELRDSDKTIEIKDSHGNFIKLSKAGIEIKSIKDVKVDARAKIDMKAISDFSAQGMKLDLTAKGMGSFKASGKLDLKASGNMMVQGAITNIKGGMINLN